MDLKEIAKKAFNDEATRLEKERLDRRLGQRIRARDLLQRLITQAASHEVWLEADKRVESREDADFIVLDGFAFYAEHPVAEFLHVDYQGSRKRIEHLRDLHVLLGMPEGKVA